jgi:hypothetical protein
VSAAWPRKLRRVLRSGAAVARVGWVRRTFTSLPSIPAALAAGWLSGAGDPVRASSTNCTAPDFLLLISNSVPLHVLPGSSDPSTA